MKIVSFVDGQSGKDWLDWRTNGVGASDIGVIMGSNVYKTLLTLWDEKCGFKGKDYINPAMAHGIKNENKAREWVNKKEKIKLEPICVEDMKNPYFRASLDGYDSEKKILTEIKCPISKDILEKARENRNLPLAWLHQIQWQIILCNPVRAFIAVWDYRTEECITVEAFAQPTLQKEMREKAQEFWRMVQMGVPPKPSEKDYIHIDNPELKSLLLEFQNHTGVEKVAQNRKKELRAKIIDYGDDGNFTCNGYYITRYAPRTIYDIDRMKKDGIEVDSYIKKNKGIEYYRISCPKN